MNKHMKLLFSALLIIVIVLAVAITRFFHDTGKNTYEGGGQSVIAKKLSTDESGSFLFQDVSGKYGLADASERVTVSPEWDKLTFTGTGLCIAERQIKGNKLLGCIDYEGNAVVPFIYDTIEHRSVNGFGFYTASAHSDGSCVIYNDDLTPAFTRSWNSFTEEDNEITLTTDKGSYIYSVSPKGFALKNAVVHGKADTSEYKIDITSKLLLSKLSVSMLEVMSENAGRYIRYAFSEDEADLADIPHPDNAVFTPLFPDDPQLVSKRLRSIPDIFLYSTRSDDDIPHFAVAVTADTELTYHDDNGKLSHMNEKYKAVIEFSGGSAGELKAVSAGFEALMPEYPAPEPEHPSIIEHADNENGYTSGGTSSTDTGDNAAISDSTL
ncbi:MAG: hypothetical protein BWZ04_00341 [Firmicutes bacterium ADurb.BinA205]|nr:MAG: hypothetical protein BWZ04_00341 [Firmicutes bacterium ADurb.BinA205]